VMFINPGLVKYHNFCKINNFNLRSVLLLA